MRFALLLAALALLGAGVVGMVFMVPSSCACIEEPHFLEMRLEASPEGVGFRFYAEATNRGEGTFLPSRPWNATLVVLDSRGSEVHREEAREQSPTAFRPGEGILLFNAYWDPTMPNPVARGTYEAVVTLDVGFTREARATVEF